MLSKTIVHLFLSIFLIQIIEAKNRHLDPLPQRKWMTLNGGQPEVIAKGGFSGFFPDSSLSAYDLAKDYSLPGTILYCNVQYTKDGIAFCGATINLQNITNIQDLDHKGGTTYNISGQEIQGWFAFDYSSDFVFNNLTLKHNILSRPDVFDSELVTDPVEVSKDNPKQPRRLWLNFENVDVYQQHNISVERILQEGLERLPEFISSTHIGFLKSVGPNVAEAKTKAIFKFLEKDVAEPSTGETYGSLATNLSTIKAFASGILVPKEYIWPTNKARFLDPATTLVQDAHKLGLAVYASGFANDNFISYNYSYDPTKEYLQFIDNSMFSVDGFLTDFPSTASEAIGCINHEKNASKTIKALIISHNGASGDYPGATDLAYQKAIDDGVDIIDCTVQMSKDGVAFCLDKPNLMTSTTAARLFMDRTSNVPEIQKQDGIFSFDLTWSEIQSLKPQIESPFPAHLARNPLNANSGKFVTLSEFLELAKTKAVTGILVFIQNAPYLASNKGLDIVGAVSTALSNATFDKQSTQKVLIQSDDNQVLLKFKDFPNYQKVLYIDQQIDGAPAQTAQEIKKSADAVYVHRYSITFTSNFFAYNFTTTVPDLHNVNISVYVGVLKNEFENMVFDYFSDPYVELATYIGQQVDGVVTDFPATANSFMRSSCMAKRSVYAIRPLIPGTWIKSDPIAEPPTLSVTEVADPPLPLVAKNPTSDSLNSTATSSSPTVAPPPKSSSTSTTANNAVLFAALVVFLVVLV